jgi:hypothetical protein
MGGGGAFQDELLGSMVKVFKEEKSEKASMTGA